jgi:hypothetical protein
MPYTRIQTSNADINRLQDNIAKVVNPLEVQPLAGGNMLKDVALTTSQTSVPHKLDHTPQFFIISDINANATVWRSATSDSQYIYLTASASCVVSMWVN